MDCANASYDAIAEWYDGYLSRPIYGEVILPGLLELVGDVRGQRILDLACGQGWVARVLSQRGAIVTGVDLSRKLLDIAERHERTEPLGIRYVHDDARTLGRLDESSFDGVVCNLALIDIPDLEATMRATRRVLRADGWLVFSITHPCFELPGARWITRDDGTVAREVAGYFAEGFWRSENPDGVRGKVGSYHRMLSTYLNALAQAGFCLEHMLEPQATGRRLEQVPGNAEVPPSLLVRARTHSVSLNGLGQNPT